MSIINEVGATAFVIASMRAMEEKREQKIFDDPYAKWFANPEIDEKVRFLIAAFPPSLEVVRYRVCIMGEIVARSIADGVRQVVTLGAGFDMRAEIFRADGVRFCDVDQPAVLTYKREVLESNGVAPCTYILCNYLEVDLPEKLAEAGFDLTAPTLFVWEGNTMYLPRDLIHAFLDKLRARFPAMRIAFDYFSQKVIDRTTGNEEVTLATDRFENSFGVKWLTGFDDLPALAQRHDLEIVETGGMIDVGNHHNPEAAAELAYLLGFYSYCVLRARP